MKIIILLFCPLSLYGQPVVLEAVDQYCTDIKIKLDRNQLGKFETSQMSDCGGSVTGYFASGKLVYIDAMYGVQFGYIHKTYFVRDTAFYKITEEVYQPVQSPDEYCKTHTAPNGECDYHNLKYENISTTVWPAFKNKSIRLRGVTNTPIADLHRVVHSLIECGKSMREELDGKGMVR